jgi:Na+-transporting NADH:ubiquinone oxidoreductase subunit NqrB
LCRLHSQTAGVDPNDFHRAQFGGRCQRDTESTRSTSHVQDSFDSANILFQKPAGIPAMMINARQFSLDKFVAASMDNRITRCVRRIMDILDSSSFLQQFSELRSVGFSHI